MMEINDVSKKLDVVYPREIYIASGNSWAGFQRKAPDTFVAMFMCKLTALSYVPAPTKYTLSSILEPWVVASAVFL